jgi:hypothetical protein
MFFLPILSKISGFLCQKKGEKLKNLVLIGVSAFPISYVMLNRNYFERF